MRFRLTNPWASSAAGPARTYASVAYTFSVVALGVLIYGLAQRTPQTGPAETTLVVRQSLPASSGGAEISRAAAPPQTIEEIRQILCDAEFLRAAGQQAELAGLGLAAEQPTAKGGLWADAVSEVSVEELPAETETELRFALSVEAANETAAEAAAQALADAYRSRASETLLEEARRSFDLRQQMADDASAAVAEAQRACENFERDHAAELTPPPTDDAISAAASVEPEVQAESAPTPELALGAADPQAEAAGDSSGGDDGAADSDERVELASLLQQRTELLEKFTAAHPKIRDLDHRIAELENRGVTPFEPPADPVESTPTVAAPADAQAPQVVANAPAAVAPLAPDPVLRTALLVRLDQLSGDLEAAKFRFEQAAAATQAAGERVARLEASTVEIVDRGTIRQGESPKAFAAACGPAALWAVLMGALAGGGANYRLQHYRTPEEMARSLGLNLLGSFRPRLPRLGVILGTALGSVSGLSRAAAELGLAIVLGWIVYLAVQEPGFVRAWQNDPWSAFGWAVGQLRQFGA